MKTYKTCICLQDFYFNNKKIFEKNHTYEYEIWNETTNWVIYDINGGVYDSGYQFHNQSFRESFLFTEYFVDIKKYRKQKLEKINETE